ncbi:MAG: ASCH domain-containing protein [Erythrobacter sp.]
MTHPSVAALWQRFRALRPDAPEETPLSFHFCDNQGDADLCADLVVAGRKRATAASRLELERGGIPLPKPGDLAVVTDFDGKARAVIETTKVDEVRFGDVTADFARAEGEGDLTLAWWRNAHDAYYRRVLVPHGIEVNDDLSIFCEHFEVVMLAESD